jgi:hypothetical protein
MNGLLDKSRLAEIYQSFSWQAKAATALGSPIYSHIFEAAAARLGKGDVLDQILAQWVGLAKTDLPALRWVGGLHYLALAGQAPALAGHFPSCGGAPNFATLWAAIEQTQADHIDFLVQFMTGPPQTNEVQRSALILPGLKWIAAQTGGDMELLEIGSSAGLNQFPDQVHVDYGTFALGSRDAALSLSATWHGPPLMDHPIQVIARGGCDLTPIDALSSEGALRLQAYIWPDQDARMARLRVALALAARRPPFIDRSPAAAWLADRLARPQAASVRIIYHSYVWAYIPPAERSSITKLIEDTASRLSPGQNLAWLRAEDDEEQRNHYLSATMWPLSKSQRLARCNPHGQWLYWLA